MDIELARAHRQFPAAAEYLSSIYILLRDYGLAANTRLAEWNGVSASAVTQALSRLKKLGLVNHERYENVFLTDNGRRLATKVLRRHYLIEHLLVVKLGYPWDKADDEAKLLQSQISDELTEHLFRELGSPQTCPHGNPMPGAAIEAKLLAAPKLSDAPEHLPVTILRITEEGEQFPDLLSFCYEHGLRPGVRVEAIRVDDQQMRLRPVSRNHQAAANADFAIRMVMADLIRYEAPA